jgi:hypothetical protein
MYAFGISKCVYNPSMEWSRLREGIAEFVHGLALSGYEKNLRQQFLELNDLFLLLCFMETVGLPNPATIYLLEVYPYFLEEFHAWHRRMGMERSPLDNLPCC